MQITGPFQGFTSSCVCTAQNRTALASVLSVHCIEELHPQPYESDCMKPWLDDHTTLTPRRSQRGTPQHQLRTKLCATTAVNYIALQTLVSLAGYSTSGKESRVFGIKCLLLCGTAIVLPSMRFWTIRYSHLVHPTWGPMLSWEASSLLSRSTSS